MRIARRLSIHGRVQGVFYRGWTVETARDLGLAGWVRNRRDGTVEALVQGEDAAIDRLIALAAQGPPAARVEQVEAAEIDPDESLTGFTQQPTA
jgi:acylphosphatase